MPVPSYESFAGTRVYTNYSGLSTGGALIQSGPGILNTIMSTNPQQSGKAVGFFDVPSQMVVAGLAAFAATSGFTTLGVVPPAYYPALVSGDARATAQEVFKPIILGVPFFSGLAFDTASGCQPFTVTYTPLAKPVF